MSNVRRLRELVGEESMADAIAAQGRFGEASAMMKSINRERADILRLPRNCNPNVLRARAEELIS